MSHTQHHIGASKWQKISDEEVVGHHQLRAAHQRYTSLDLKTVENKGHGHAMVKHLYKKINGEWKLAGLRPAVRWNEFELKKSLKGSNCGSGYVATFLKLSTADRTQQLSWKRLLNQDTTLSWLVARATMFTVTAVSI